MIYWISFYSIQVILLFLRSRRLYVLMVAFSILFSGLRFENGNDWFNYLNIIQNINNYEGNVEPGFIYLAKLFKLFPYSEQFLFFSFSFATLGLVGLSFKRIASNKLAFFLYLLTPGLFLNSFHIIRQMLAVSLFLYAVVEYTSNKSRFLFLFCGILAVSFHYTAIIPFVSFVVFYRFSLKPKLLPCLLAVAVMNFSYLISFTNLPLDLLLMFSDTKFELYSKLVNIENGYKILTINLISMFYLYGYYNYKLLKDQIYLKLFIVGVVLLNLFSNFSEVSRVSYYFIPFGLIIFCNVTDMMVLPKQIVARSLYIALYIASTVLAFSSLELLRLGGADFPSLLNYSSIIGI